MTGDGPRDDRGDPGHQVRGEELPVRTIDNTGSFVGGQFTYTFTFMPQEQA